jgi:CSLREA domain-containing protein
MSTMYRFALVLLLLGAATPTPAAVVEVRLENFRFVPNDVTIQPGDTVRWTNQMGFHDVRADDGSFSRPPENAPWTFERTFTQGGEVFVHCSVHSVPGADINSAMNGRINVANITVVPGADITVNTVSDELNADGDCSLREAITSANSNSASDACAIGGEADSIRFGVAGTIVLNRVLPAITSDVAIVGPAGDKVIISGGGAAPLFVVRSGGILRLEALTLSGGLASDGGAIINQPGGTLTVFNSTFSGNRAQQSGGAIRNLGVATIVNSTFAGNAATESGGALAGSGVGGNMTLINCTIAANSAALGGGIATEQQGAVTLRNTLIATNAGGNCLALDSGTITDGGGNLDDGTSCRLVDSTSSSNAGAGLDPGGLRDNGGPTQTIALVAGGGAIDRGIEAVCANATTVNGRDQRGEPRPRDGDANGDARCDIGAFELNPLMCRGRVANISISNNTIFGGPDSGTPYTGTLRGTNGNDVIVGTDANDSINGAGGNDIICGGAGRDTLRGGQGRDQLFGGGGRDRLFGGSGTDLCDGGTGRDKARGCEQVKSVP